MYSRKTFITHFLNETTFKSLLRNHFASICLFANRYVENMSIAEDIAEESFLKLWNNRNSITNANSIKSWLYSTTRNACLDHLRRQEVKSRNEKNYNYLQEAETESYHLEAMIRTELLEELHAALQQLPDQCRLVFTKLYIEGKGVAHTAEEMNLSINTVKSHKARGLMLLRKKLEPLGVLLFLH